MSLIDLRTAGAAGQFLSVLADSGSDRLTVSQAAFFFKAAKADAMGEPLTRTQILQDGEFRPSVRNSYRQLLPPSRKYPTGLGWLQPEPNPNDDREQFLRVSTEGLKVVRVAFGHLT